MKLVDQMEAETTGLARAADPLAVFAAMYTRVTQRITDEISEGTFDDADRMRHFQEHFAHRWLDRVSINSTSWQKATGRPRLALVQHLLLGMNAHINFDLPIAAAGVLAVRGESPAVLRDDFFRVTDVLLAMLAEVQRDLGDVSPGMKLLDLLGGYSDERVANFSLSKAREAAWLGAITLASIEPGDRLPAETLLDAYVGALAAMIERPGGMVAVGFGAVRRLERKPLDRVVAALRGA